LQGFFASAGQGGVAYAAHIGGFIAGLILIKIFALGTKAQNISPGQG
jgi:membrane associated rhomboid family serine protease